MWSSEEMRGCLRSRRDRVQRERIGEYRCGSGEWPLGVDDPFGPSQGSERGVEGAPVSKGYEIAEEGHPPGLMQRRGAASRNGRRNRRNSALTRQEVAGLAGDPARTVRRQAAAGHNHVHVRVVSQAEPPGVQHGG